MAAACRSTAAQNAPSPPAAASVSEATSPIAAATPIAGGSAHGEGADRVAHLLDGAQVALDELAGEPALVDDPHRPTVGTPPHRLDDLHGGEGSARYRATRRSASGRGRRRGRRGAPGSGG
jgi:hypothetical protein